MNTGERISNLRKEKGFSQEYLAHQIGVSRQAVHKWEKEISSPDTQNLIALAQVLGTSVEYIVNGNMQTKADAAKPRKKLPKLLTYILTVIITAVITFIATILFIANAPVAFDAGACGGGFATHVFDKYVDTLIEDHQRLITDGMEVTEIQPVRGSHNISWEGKAIYMSFDAEFTLDSGEICTIPLRFMGERRWIETYDWHIISDYNLAKS